MEEHPGIGMDADGQIVTIGDTDSMGFKVGYIDKTGLAWESREERDSATFYSIYYDESLKTRKDIESGLARAGVLEENREAVLMEALAQAEVSRALKSFYKRKENDES